MYLRHSLLILLSFSLGSVLLAQTPPTSSHIHVDQFGYLPDVEKVAVISDPHVGFNSSESFTPGATYELRSYPDGQMISSGSPVMWNQGATDAQSGDKAWLFDFSSVTTPGEYYVYDSQNNVRSFAFTIGGDVYGDVLKQAVRTFFYQRSGFAKQTPYTDVKWADGISHMGAEQDLDCRLVTNPAISTSLDLSGGWYDAGDYNKYVNFTHTVIHNLLAAYEKNPVIWTDDYNIPESGNGIPDLLDETKYELEWLLKMQLPNGTGLMKVSVTDFTAASPPSADVAPRRYGPAQASATRTLCSNFAHAAIVYGSLPDAGMKTFADTLLARAEKAWNWTENNPGTSSYDNAGFQSANPEVGAYEQEATLFAAAVYLYAKTGDTKYKTYIDTNYTNLHALQWGFWYPFETVFQDALLYYANLGSATPSVAQAIKNSFINSATTGNAALLPAYQNATDPYRAYLEDQNYVWGSNMVKSHAGIILHNMDYYDLASSVDQKEDFRNAAAGYLNYLHGVNPLNLSYLTNMGAYGAENSINEMYHGWFGDGTDWDNALTSSKGPAPAYLSGGANPSYAPSQGYFSPPQDQPSQKSYLDWNTSWPQNSWEITEPAIYYQAAYIHLLSQYVEQSANTLSVEYESFVAFVKNSHVELQWKTARESGSDYFLVERSIDGQMFARVGQLSAKGSETEYAFTDQTPPEGMLFYRLKEVELDGDFTYSAVKTVFLSSSSAVEVYPNPVLGIMNVNLRMPVNTAFEMELLDLRGKVMKQKSFLSSSQSAFNFSLDIKSLPVGVYVLKIQSNSDILYKKINKK